MPRRASSTDTLIHEVAADKYSVVDPSQAYYPTGD
jgi:hypothetical protein